MNKLSISLGIPQGSGFSNLQNLNIGNLVSMAVNLILVIAVVLFFFMLVFGGIRWILSMGDKGKTEAARGQVVSAFVGLAIVFSTYAIVELIQAYFGVTILTLNLNF